MVELNASRVREGVGKETIYQMLLVGQCVSLQRVGR